MGFVHDQVSLILSTLTLLLPRVGQVRKVLTPVSLILSTLTLLLLLRAVQHDQDGEGVTHTLYSNSTATQSIGQAIIYRSVSLILSTLTLLLPGVRWILAHDVSLILSTLTLLLQFRLKQERKEVVCVTHTLYSNSTATFHVRSPPGVGRNVSLILSTLTLLLRTILDFRIVRWGVTHTLYSNSTATEWGFTMLEVQECHSYSLL